MNSQSAHAFDGGPHLLADIGATNARLALEREPGRLEAVEVLLCSDYAGIVDLVQDYLARQGHPVVRHAAVAIANPVCGDHVSMTNRDWQFSIEAVRRELGFDTLLVVNDFSALAMALPRLSPDERIQVGGGEAILGGVIGVIGPGTGLGVSGLIPADGRWIALGSEGGHTSFAPADERELFILQYAWRQMPHVSSERFVSGPGLTLIHCALAERNGIADIQALSAADIVSHARAGSDPLCAETVDCFCAMLGTVASDLALTLGAVGGIYMGGGVVPRLGELFLHSSFRRRFEAKGRFADYLSRIPTFLITAPYPALLGVSALLDQRLQGSSGGGPQASAAGLTP